MVINNAMTINGAFEAPSPNEWLVLDPDSKQRLARAVPGGGRDGVGPVRLELIGSTTFPSGVLRLAYRPSSG